MAHGLSEQTEGVYIIAATPFTDTGAIDYASADRLIEFYIQKEVAGITIMGMMGEALKLSTSESYEFMSYMMKRVGGRVPVVVGVSDPGLINLANISQKSMDNGAAGVMIAPISGLNTEEKIYNYFAQVFEALGPDIPVCYQDYPQTTGVYISVDCYNRLVKDFPQMVMFKHEDCPALTKLSQIRKTAVEQDLRRLSVLVGNGGLYLPQELRRGADGAMTGFAYPEMLVQVVALQKAGKYDEAENLFDIYLPLVRYEQQPGFGLAVRKEVLRRRGALENSSTRAPGPKLNETDHQELSRLITRLETKLQEIN